MAIFSQSRIYEGTVRLRKCPEYQDIQCAAFRSKQTDSCLCSLFNLAWGSHQELHYHRCWLFQECCPYFHFFQCLKKKNTTKSEQKHFWNPKVFPKEWKTACYSTQRRCHYALWCILNNISLQDSRTAIPVTKSRSLWEWNSLEMGCNCICESHQWVRVQTTGTFYQQHVGIFYYFAVSAFTSSHTNQSEEPHLCAGVNNSMSGDREKN